MIIYEDADQLKEFQPTSPQEDAEAINLGQALRDTQPEGEAASDDVEPEKEKGETSEASREDSKGKGGRA